MVPSKGVVFVQVLADALLWEVDEVSREWNEWILVLKESDHQVEKQRSNG